ncbi:Trypanosomal VSG domain [Trypanosoma vivax]|nr:Trypanosomal VSG domain [Trypanosoma vivax]
MLCCLLSFALILAAARLGRGAGENTAEFRAACAIATQAQDIVEEPTPKAKGTLAKLLEREEEMKREDIAAALAAVAVIKVTAAKGGVTEERKNATLLAAEMLEAGTWNTSATLAHAVALAVQAAQEWKQVAPLMDHAKKAANKGLYALSEDSADNISDLGESKVDWKIPSAPAPQAIGAEDSGGYKFNNHSGQALAADITCRCPSAGQTNECIKIQSGGNVITSAVNSKTNAVAAWRTLKKYCIASMRGRATQGSILASIAHLKAMLGTNTAGSTTGTHIPHITRALGQQGQPTSDKQDIKFVTYGAYAAGKIPWEQELIDASTAIDKARRLAEHATNAADLALGLVTTWAPIRRNETAPTTRNDEKETANTETTPHQRADTRKHKTAANTQPSARMHTNGRHMERGQVPKHCASRRKRKRAHRQRTHHSDRHARRHDARRTCREDAGMNQNEPVKTRTHARIAQEGRHTREKVRQRKMTQGNIGPHEEGTQALTATMQTT